MRTKPTFKGSLLEVLAWSIPLFGGMLLIAAKAGVFK